MNNYPNITQRKTAEINALKAKVVASTKRVAVSRSAYEASIVKSELFQRLLTDAQARLVTATDELYQSSKANQNLDATINSDRAARLNAMETKKLINELIAQVQAVVTTTLTAASAIVEMSRLITDRKASNPLISSDLVTRAQASVTAANRAVSLIINTLASVTNALSAAGQAQDTVLIVEREIKDLKQILNPTGKVEGKAVPIQRNVELQYNEAREVENTTQNGAKQARDQQLGAEGRLTVATNELQKDQAALAAAEAAVGSN